jgi:predicted SAM-dependent methyltransferase
VSAKSAVRSWLLSAGVYEQASRAWMWLEPRSTNAIRAAFGTNQRLISEYLSSNSTPKLHIGCGGNHLAGWLNTELCPRGSEVFLDATRPFPFDDGTFALIYSEHMIEHIPYADAVGMARECFRVLRRGGTVRLVTPSLEFLRLLLEGAPDPRHEAYFEFYRRHHRINGPLSAAHLVNHFVRSWGHQFIYDRSSLRELLLHAGFQDVEEPALSESSNPLLRRLAKTDRMPEGMLAMESLVMEARKP